MVTVTYGNMLVLFMLLMWVLVGLMGWQARGSITSVYRSTVALVRTEQPVVSEEPKAGQVAGARTDLTAAKISPSFPVVVINRDSGNPFE
jgi:hypothetical protein